MKDFRGKIAVITGGGTGMGRSLAQQLTAEGCHIAICDVMSENMAETKRLCEAGAPSGVRVTIIAVSNSCSSSYKCLRSSMLASFALKLGSHARPVPGCGFQDSGFGIQDQGFRTSLAYRPTLPV